MWPDLEPLFRTLAPQTWALRVLLLGQTFALELGDTGPWLVAQSLAPPDRGPRSSGASPVGPEETPTSRGDFSSLQLTPELHNLGDAMGARAEPGSVIGPHSCTIHLSRSRIHFSEKLNDRKEVSREKGKRSPEHSTGGAARSNNWCRQINWSK